MPHVLCIDDELGIRHVVRLALERVGISVAEAPSAQAAMTQLETTWPDLVLMDLRLPDMPGVELAQHIRAHYPSVPVIFMSASTELSQAAEQANVHAYIEKPFKLAQLQSLIQETIAAHGSSAIGVETTP